MLPNSFRHLNMLLSLANATGMNNPKLRVHRKKLHSPFILLLCFVFIALYNVGNFRTSISFHSNSDNHVQELRSRAKSGFSLNPITAHNNTSPNEPPVGLNKSSTCSSTVKYSGRKAPWASQEAEPGGGRREAMEVEACEVFSGKWVFDNTSYPLYKESECPYMSDQLSCQKHGRPDLGYQFWRWQPHKCNLKMWNSNEMWEKIRGKRLMFVGDSVNRGQWISLICMLQSVIPADKQSITPNSELTIFRAENYNATVEFLWAPLLLESNCDHVVDHRLDERIVRPDSILRHSSHWKHADILIFNSYLWWMQGTVKMLWSDARNGVCEEIDGLQGMELAMDAWADWVVSHANNPQEKKIFFVTMSPTHREKEEWEPGSEGNCYNETMPIQNENNLRSGWDLPTKHMVERVLNRLGSKVSVVNITQISQYRKDGHPTIYRKFWDPKEMADPLRHSDCIHWCLPGVTDVWNELLFQLL